MKGDTTRELLRLVAGGAIGAADLTKGQKVAAIKAGKAELLAKDSRGALVLTDKGRKRLEEDSAPPPVRPKTTPKKPASGNGRVAVPAPAAAPGRADGPGYREELAGALDREVLLAALCARELRKNA